MTCTKATPLRTLTIALGANLPSEIGSPISTIKSVRPEIEKIFHQWLQSFPIQNNKIKSTNPLRFRWSPLFETKAIGGPCDQPDFINAVLVVDGEFFSSLIPSQKQAIDLLERFLKLERLFGREKRETSIHWGPRTLDIDFLAWGELQVNTQNLILPHPRLTERNFVLVPLVSALSSTQCSPKRIPPQHGWKE